MSCRRARPVLLFRLCLALCVLAGLSALGLVLPLDAQTAARLAAQKALVPLPAQTAVATACDLNAINSYGYGKRRTFPKLTGCTIDEATKAAPDYVRGAKILPVPRDDIPENIIVKQYPEAGAPLEYIKNGVQLTVSTRAAPPPEPDGFSVGDAANAVEGSPLEFTITRSGPGTDPASVAYTTVVSNEAGGAVPGEDYQPQSGNAVFEAGKSTAIITVQTRARPGTNGQRRLHLLLTEAPANGQIVRREGIGVIVDTVEPSTAPAFSIDDVTLNRHAPLAFTIRRSGSSAGSFSLAYTVEREGDAYAETDVLPRITFNEGQTAVSLPISDIPACGKRVTVTLSDPQPAGTVERNSATAFIVGELDPSCIPPRWPPWWLYALGGIAVIAIIAALATRARFRVREWFSPATVVCAIDRKEGLLSPINQPGLSAPRSVVRVTIEEGELTMPNAPVVSVKEPDNG